MNQYQMIKMDPGQDKPVTARDLANVRMCTRLCVLSLVGSLINCALIFAAVNGILPFETVIEQNADANTGQLLWNGIQSSKIQVDHGDSIIELPEKKLTHSCTDGYYKDWTETYPTSFSNRTVPIMTLCRNDCFPTTY